MEGFLAHVQLGLATALSAEALLFCFLGEDNMGDYQYDTGSAWHTCTCEDGSTYQCQSNQKDGAACCTRSWTAICGVDNVGTLPNTGSAWHTCTCEDGSTYQCQSNRGDGAACCTRSMPAICGSAGSGYCNNFEPLLSPGDIDLNVIANVNVSLTPLRSRCPRLCLAYGLTSYPWRGYCDKNAAFRSGT